MGTIAALGVGLATRSVAGRVLDAWYPHVTLVADGDRTAADRLADVLGHGGPSSTHTVDAELLGRIAHLGVGDAQARAVADLAASLTPDRDAGGWSESVTTTGTARTPIVTLVADLAQAPADVHDVYLRLHLLSHRLVVPHGASLDGAFGLLPNVVWTDHGPREVDGFEELRLRAARAGTRLRVTSVDKFPRMTDYVVPSGVRIADADRVRLGAHLAAGTTVMHEGFVNFNAGTLGASMVEGRISAGVVVGDGSDIGGGASIMGTLSGGGTEVIRIGERCLVGANAGIGISLGDDCVVEAGLYVTAGTKVALPDGTVVKARELSGVGGLLYRRDSQTGAVVALPRGDGSRADWGGLNTALHAND